MVGSRFESVQVEIGTLGSLSWPQIIKFDFSQHFEKMTPESGFDGSNSFIW